MHSPSFLRCVRSGHGEAAEWFWNQGWFCNQNSVILKQKPMILQPRTILKPKKWFRNQWSFRSQGHLETTNGTAQQSSGVLFFSLEASSWLCHLDTWLTWPISVRCGCIFIKGRNAAARTLLLSSTPPHPTHPIWNDAMLSVRARYVEQGTQLQGRSCPTPPHPTPPHRIWRRCLVGCGRKCVKGRNAAARTLLSPPHPTPPHPPPLKRCHVECDARISRRQRTCPTPPHPTPPHLETMPWLSVAARNAAVRTVLLPPPHPPALWDDATQSVAARILVAKWRRFWFPNRTDFGCGIIIFWLRNRLFLVAESSVNFWLRKCLFLVAEASIFGCKRVWFWLRNRRNLVAEAPIYGCGIGDYSHGDTGCAHSSPWGTSIHHHGAHEGLRQPGMKCTQLAAGKLMQYEVINRL